VTNEQRTGGARAGDVRAHEQAQYATPPTVPTYPTVNRTSSEGPSGIATRENPDGRYGPLDAPEPFLAVYSIDHNRLVRIGSFHSQINDVMRQFRWATLERGDGWYFPEPYLSRVELALVGAGITLANRNGGPTPLTAQAEKRSDQTKTAAILADLHAAREAGDPSLPAVRNAREECKRAYAEAIAARHPEPEPAEVTE